jgi:hypothetical protein
MYKKEKELKKIFKEDINSGNKKSKAELNILEDQKQNDAVGAFENNLSNEEFVFDKYSLKPYEQLAVFHANFKKRIKNLKKPNKIKVLK